MNQYCWVQRPLRRATLLICIMTVILQIPATPPAGAIYAGEDASIVDFPWMTSLQEWNGAAWQHVCGGTLIDPGWVLTAAHCVWDNELEEPVAGSSLRVVIGKDKPWSDADRIQVGEPVLPTDATGTPLYGTAPLWHGDVALLPLRNAVSGVSTLRLSFGEMPALSNVTALGWGSIADYWLNSDSPRQLQRIDVLVRDDSECEFGNSLVAAAQICTKDFDSATTFVVGGPRKGDSGGPLLLNGPSGWLQLGIASHLPQAKQANFLESFGDGDPNYTGWASIRHFRDWITQTIAGKPSSSQLDLAFVIDTTGSMWDDIDAVKRAASGIVDRLSGDFRVALVDYKDHPISPYGDPRDYPSRIVQQFSSGKDSLVSAINSLGADGGGDFPESVYSGLMRGLSLDWRSGARRSIIWMGDAPPHDPEPITNLTFLQVVGAALSKRAVVVPAGTPRDGSHWVGEASLRLEAEDFENAVQIYSVEVGGNGGPAYEDLARETSGKYFNPADASQVVDAISDAITSIVSPELAPFAIAVKTATSRLIAEGTPRSQGVDGHVYGYLQEQRKTDLPVTSAALTTGPGGGDLLTVKFLVGGNEWILCFARATPTTGTVELCGPDGCAAGSGADLLALSPQQRGATERSFGLGPQTSTSTTLTGAAPTVSTSTSTTTSSTTTSPSTTTTTLGTLASPTTTGAPTTSDRCGQLRHQYHQTSDPLARLRILSTMRATGCSPP